MNENLLNRILKDRKRRTRSLALILCLSMIVSLGTFAGFRKTAVAKVYTREVLDCPYTHEGAEPVAHVHNDDCYDGETLVCTLPELEAHTHSDACYTERQVLTCTLEENPGHQHGDACYTEREELRCGLEENPGHQHGDACYTEREVLRCGLEENPGHQHGETCYDENGVLTCQIPEGEGAHTHTAECYETVRELTCQIPEGEGAHAHTAECYETVRELTCGKAELTPHVHGAECIRTEEITVDEPEETAEPEVSTEPEVTTEPEEIAEPEATAAPEMPVSDPNADLESASDWERDFDGMELSGNWAEDLVLVAATQQGHGESQNNFEAVLNDAGDAWVRHGYTRYGAWSGAPYADEWSAMFVSFCLRYAGIPAENVPSNPTAALMAESFQKGELFAGPDYLPAVGDLIFFDTDDEEGIDHMGIVYHVDAEDGSINAVEGSRTDAVETFSYHLDDEEIAGYGILPQNPNFIPIDENIEDVTDDLIVMSTDEEEEKKETEETKPVEETKTAEEVTVPAVPMPAQSWERTAGGIKVTVDAPEGAFPENTKIAVTPVNGNSLKDTVSDAVSGEVLEVQAVDITFFDADGNEIEPALPIRVVMTPAETEHAEEKTNVVHIDLDQQTAEVIEQAAGTETDNSEVVFDADAFTIYAIVYTVHFEYEVDGETYTSASMPGAEYTSLADVIRGLGIVSEEEVGTFVSKIATVASTNEEVAVVENTEEEGLCVRVLRDGDAQIVITMQDGAQFRVDVVADGETTAGNETATVSTKGDLYLPTEARVEAKALDDAQSESAIAAVEAKEGTPDSNAAAPSAYQVFDISLENVEADQYDGFQVEVTLPENVVGRDFRLFHIHDGETTEIELNTVSSPVDNTGLEVVSGFTFETKDFSEFVLKYTVDFEYTDPITGKTYYFSLNGEDSINLTDLLVILGIKREDEVGQFVIEEVEDVKFSDPELVKVTHENDSWVLESLAPFETEEILTISLENGGEIVVRVTDEQTQGTDSDLENFLSDAIISGVQIVDGKYVVEKDVPYSIMLKFKETFGHQYDNHATLTYTIPEGIYIPENKSYDKEISIVSAGKTYRVKAHYNITTDGKLTVKFDETDPDFPRLANTNNVEIRAEITAAFNGEKEVIHFSDSVDKTVKIDDDDHAEAFVEKTGSYDEKTGKFTYTIKVTSRGDTTNVNVKDVISGNALIFNKDVQVSGNSSAYTTNPLPSGQGGFDYTFESMSDGEEIIITYTANVDYSKDPDHSGKITADQTKNTVTADYNDKPHTSDYTHEITYSSIQKEDGKVVGNNGDITTLSWSVVVNPQRVVSLAGSTFTDRINKGNATAMYYSGNGPTIKVYNENDELVDTRTPPWAEVGVTGSDVSRYIYTFPAGDGKFKYVFEYTTDVDRSGVTTDVTVSNNAEYKFGEDNGSSTIINDDKSSITKSVVDFNTTEVTWKAVIHVPYNNGNGLSKAEVVDTPPARALQDYGWTWGIDEYIEDTLTVEGTLSGESYSYVVDSSFPKTVKIIFSKDGQPGLKGVEGGHDITITLKTKVDERWLHEAELYGGYWQTHINTIEFDGQTSQAQIEIGGAGVEKKCEKTEWDIDNDGVNETLFHYDIVLQNVYDDQVVVEDSFDTSILELVTDPTNLDNNGMFPPNQTNYYNLQVYGGNRSNQYGNRGNVNYSETENGVRFSVDSLPKDNNGGPYSYYRICYYLKLKDGIDLEDLAAANGGKYTIENNATWNGHEGTSKYEVTYDVLDKKLIQAATSDNAVAEYEISFNPKKATLHNHEPITITDTLSETLGIDHSSVSITTDPANADVVYVFENEKDENGFKTGRTIVIYTIPDNTAVTIRYKASIIGTGNVNYVNTVEGNGEKETVNESVNMDASGGGSGKQISVKAIKSDGYNAAIVLPGVKFKIYAEDGRSLYGDDYIDPDGDPRSAIIETDENGVLDISYEKYSFSLYENTRYYLEEIEPPENYLRLTSIYEFTLHSQENSKLVDPLKFHYLDGGSFLIKNWPYEGLIVEKSVVSEAAEDHTKSFNFKISILDDQGELDTSVNKTYGDDLTFAGGVATFTLKDKEQMSAWNMPENTRFKVEELNSEGFVVSVRCGETTKDGAGEYTGITEAGTFTHVIFTNSKEETGSLKIKKTVTENSKTTLSDAAKSKLAGTYTFTIYTNEACTEAYKVDGVAQTVSITIEADGAAVTSEEITGLPAGDYWIKETTPTNGSTPVTNPVKVTVVAGKTGEEAVIAEFTNNIETVEKTATKVWKNGDTIIAWPEDVESVEFTLYKTVGGETTEVSVSDLPNYTGPFVNPVTVSRNTVGQKASWADLPTRILVTPTPTGTAEEQEPTTSAWYDVTYSVKETKVTFTKASGKAPLETEEAINTVYYPTWNATDQTITNNPKISIEGTKTWNVLGSSIPTVDPTLTLTRKSSKVGAVSETVTPADGQPEWSDVAGQANARKYKFTELDKYDADGYLYTYSVTEASFKVGNVTYIVKKDGDAYIVKVGETEVKTFTVTQSDNNITNTETKEFEFTKIWKDMMQQDTTWPAGKTITVTFNAYTDKTQKVFADQMLTFSATEAPPKGWVRTTSEDGKKTTFKITGLPAWDPDGKELTYYVVETKVDDYNDPSYAFDNKGTPTIKSDNDSTKGKAVNTDYIINTPVGSYELPETGGIGTTLFTALGGLMAATAGAVLTLRKKRKS